MMKFSFCLFCLIFSGSCVSQPEYFEFDYVSGMDPHIGKIIEDFVCENEDVQNSDIVVYIETGCGNKWIEKEIYGIDKSADSIAWPLLIGHYSEYAIIIEYLNWSNKERFYSWSRYKYFFITRYLGKRILVVSNQVLLYGSSESEKVKLKNGKGPLEIVTSSAYLIRPRAVLKLESIE